MSMAEEIIMSNKGKSFVPTKYENLLKSQKGGCRIPEVFLLSGSDLKEKNFDNLNVFLETFSSSQAFIVRSAVDIEDGSANSYAGFFYSSGQVKRIDIEKEIEYALTENSRRVTSLQNGKIKPAVHLMVSQFIVGVAGGVAFSPWLYFYDHALVQYATTPREVVVGHKSKSMFLAHAHTARYGNIKKDDVYPWSAQLADAMSTLHKIFDFQLDIEWVFDGTQVYILQVRPVTIAPSATQTCLLKKYTTNPNENFDIYGTSLGKLSPLSFDLITNLYKNAHVYCGYMHIQGGESFLRRMPNGSTITNIVKYTRYFKNARWYSPFMRSVLAQRTLDEISDVAVHWATPTLFTLSKIQEAFSYWQTAQAYERLLKNQHATAAFPFEYEIGMNKKYVYGTQSLSSIWKQHFQDSLIPLRAIAQASPEYLWATVQDVIQKKHFQGGAYTTELGESSNAIAVQGTSIQQKFISGTAVSGIAFCIEDPALWGGQLPREVVIVTPRIPSSWIMELPNVHSIIVTELAELAHAAIVLREHSVPTLIVPQKIYKHIIHGKLVDFG